jgi:hypothetical protein
VTKHPRFPRLVDGSTATFDSHEHIFKLLPSVLLLVTNEKKNHYFPNFIKGRRNICISKDHFCHPPLRIELPLPNMEAFPAVLLPKK